jgi:FlaA1/EpsC-like NDP-sugar epimerase
MTTALAAKVEGPVVLSTARAAAPINAMGISREVMVKHLVSAKIRIAAADGLTGSPSMSFPSSA